MSSINIKWDEPANEGDPRDYRIQDGEFLLGDLLVKGDRIRHYTLKNHMAIFAWDEERDGLKSGFDSCLLSFVSGPGDVEDYMNHVDTTYKMEFHLIARWDGPRHIFMGYDQERDGYNYCPDIEAYIEYMNLVTEYSDKLCDDSWRRS